MSLYDDIRTRMFECMKSGEPKERDVLKTLIGEIQLKSSREGKEISDELTEKTLSFFKENALECLKYAHTDDPYEAVDSLDASYEIAIYDKFLPTYESVVSIIQLLNDSVNQLQAAKADGPATGMAMGILKKSGKKVRGKDVSDAVKIIRES